MMSLQDRYQASFTYWNDANDGGWQDWFNPDIPADLAYPAETEFSSDVVAEMLEAGETLWHHPGWIRDLWALIEEWALDGLLIKVRLFSEWLCSTLPDEPLDQEVGNRLELLSKGEFCDVFTGSASDWLVLQQL